jgi:hypothetical protein
MLQVFGGPCHRMKREAGAHTKNYLVQQDRRCPRNGKRAKADQSHCPAALAGGKAIRESTKTEKCLFRWLASPETGLRLIPSCRGGRRVRRLSPSARLHSVNQSARARPVRSGV